MTLWSPEMFDTQGPLYVAIADDISRAVRRGELQPGQRLPTHRELARRLGVNVVTVTRGYAEAARRGLVEGEVGRGTFVKGRARPEPIVMQSTRGPAVIDFHFNLPVGDASLLDARAMFTELAADASSVPLHSEYTSAGLEAHRVAGATWMARSGLVADPARVLVCGGAQHAMAVTFAALAGPGDLVLCEELTYPGMKSLASVLRLRLTGLPLDEHGLLPDAFESACRKGSVRALYTMPTVQNPTGIVMPAVRRREVADVARRYGVPIVEDDTYGAFHPGAPPPLVSHCPELGYFITSTSKTLTPGLRIGYVHAPGEEGGHRVAERLAAHVNALGWMAAPLMAEITRRWIDDGAAARQVAWKQREMAARRELFDRVLDGIPVASVQAAPHVWLPLPAPWRGRELVDRAARRDVAVTPADLFAVGRAHAPHAVRVCLGTPPTREAVSRGVGILAGLLSGPPDVGRPLV